MDGDAKQIEAALLRIDTAEFFHRTIVASGPDMVGAILLDSDEARLLIRQAHDAIPRILDNLERQGGFKRNETRIVYYLVIRQARDPRAIGALAQYIDALPESDRDIAASPWHPFSYAVDAIEALTGQDLARRSIAELFEERHTIAAEARSSLASGPVQD